MAVGERAKTEGSPDVKDYGKTEQSKKLATPRPAAPESSTEPSKPTLMGLPGELRNRIYRSALLDPKRILVTSDANGTQPALLRVCRQLRHEAMKIFIQENHFILPIKSLDMQPQRGHWVWRSGCLARFEGGMSWGNLKRWLKLYYEAIRGGKGCARPGTPPSEYAFRADNHVVLQAFDMVEVLAKDMVAWSKVEAVLEVLKKATGHGERLAPWKE